MKHIIKKLLPLAVLLFALFAALFILSSIVKVDKDTDPSALRDEMDRRILMAPENTADVLFLGNSEMLAHVSPVTLWEEEGIASLNLGSVGQFMYLTKGYLKLALSVQSPKLVVLDMDSLFLSEVRGENYVLSCLGDVFPVFRDHDRWKDPFYERLLLSGEEKKKDGENKEKGERLHRLKGYNYSAEVKAVLEYDYMAPSEDKFPAPVWNHAAFKEVAEICRKRDIPLLLVSTPSIKNWSCAKHNMVAYLADKHELTYLDLNLVDLGIDWETDTRDVGDHLNDAGAQKVSCFLAGYLKDTYQLPDRRSDEHYTKTYEEAAAYYHDLVKKESREKGKDTK